VLAIECGVTAATVRAWIAGSAKPSRDNRWRLSVIAAQCGLPPPFSLTETMPPEPSTCVRRRRSSDD
jgi:hypothetical protein